MMKQIITKHLPILFAGVFSLMTAGDLSASGPDIQPNEVAVCEHNNYIGPCIKFQVEPWMRHKLVRNLGDFNDKVSSIRLGSQVWIKIYQHANFEGAGGWIIKQDIPTLSKYTYTSNATLFFKQSDWNDKVSSLIVVPKGKPQAGAGLHIGSRINMDGQVEEGFFPLPEDASKNEAKYPTIGSDINDEADCVGLVGDVTADLFENANFKGKNVRLPGMIPVSTKPSDGCYVPGKGFDLGRYQISEMVSSLIVYAGNQQPSVGPDSVVILDHIDYIGAARSFTLKQGMRYKLVPNLGSLNDRTSSIIVGKNVSLHAFEHANFGGNSVEYDTNIPVLDSKNAGWNDRISSLIVTPRGKMLEGALLTAGLSPSYFFPLPEQMSEGEAIYNHFNENLNDRSKHLIICGPAVSVTLFEHTNFGGDPRNFPDLGSPPNPCTDYRLKTYQFDEKASSIKVRTSAVMHQAAINIPPPAPPRGGEAAGQPHRAPPAITAKIGHVVQPGREFEMNTDRPGQNYRNFDMSVPEPKRCQQTCQSDPKCKAWTYVKPGVQGPNARCWLKSGVPAAKASDCCISGVKLPAGATSDVKGIKKPVTPTHIPTSRVEVQTKSIPPQLPAIPDVSGLWESNIGSVYQISQNGSNFEWIVKNKNEVGNGTIKGVNLSAQWRGRQGGGAAQGKITVVNSEGKATKIQWNNGVVFHRTLVSGKKVIPINLPKPK